MSCSVSVSIDEVASSRIRILGSKASARAKAMSCFWPTEKPAPRSRTGASNPSGSCSMKSSAWASPAAQRIRSSSIRSSSRRMLRADGAGEQEDVLEHQADRPAQRREIPLPHVDAVDRHPAGVDVVEAQQQVGQGALAGAGVADDRQRLTRLDRERDPA